jgi:hypothetical protein
MNDVVRIGVLVPAGNTIHEREFLALRPEGVEFRFAGFAYPPAGAADFCADLFAHMRAPVAELRAWGAQALLVGCTTASMLCADPAREAQLQSLAGVPVVTAASAVREALAALGLRRIAVATPYGARGNGVVVDYLRTIGITGRRASARRRSCRCRAPRWTRSAGTLRRDHRDRRRLRRPSRASAWRSSAACSRRRAFRVGIIAQPDWRAPSAFGARRPNLFFGITAGNMDSMVNRYTSTAASAATTPTRRAARAGGGRTARVIVYAQRAREAFATCRS